MLKVKSLTRNSSALDRNEKKKHIASREEIRIQGKFLVVESHYRLDPESKFLTDKEFGTTWNLAGFHSGESRIHDCLGIPQAGSNHSSLIF